MSHHLSRPRGGPQRPKPRPNYVPVPLGADDDREDVTVDAKGREWPPVEDTHLPIGIILPRLECVRPTSTGHVACCPAHSDSRPSLSITETADRTVLLHCFSGLHCNAASITEAIGLNERYLFATMTALLHAKKNGAKPAATAKARGGALTVPDINPAFAKLAKKHRNHPDAPEKLHNLAKALGANPEALDALGVGWAGGAWSIPERDHLRHVVGIVYRPEEGRRWSEDGGNRGLITPRTIGDYGGTLYVPEGMSDTAALLSVGAAAVGRPAAKSSALAKHWLREYLRDHIKTRPIVIVGDNDAAGIDGARELAAELSEHFGRGVWWALPHKQFKDVREQVNAGEWSRGLRPRGLKVSDASAPTTAITITNKEGM